MVAFATTRTRWQYTADNGNLYSFNALDGFASQVLVLGGEAAIAGKVPMSKGMRPRRCLCWLAADHSTRRSAIVYEPTADAFTTLGTTVKFNVGGVETAFVVYAMEGERHKFLGSMET